MMRTNRLGRLGAFVASGLSVWTATTLMLGIAASSCLTRPVGKEPPTTKVNFTSTISQQAVDKVDLLFAIDNSSSMGDKQKYLAEAVPDLIKGLLQPKCVNPETKVPDPSGAVASPTGSKENRYGCPGTSEPEFKPVTDMHIGIVSSSLGNLGGDVCPEANPRTNDRGRLVNIDGNGGGPVAQAQPSGFLAWFPQSADNSDPKRHPPPPNPLGDLALLTNSDPKVNPFARMVFGVGQDGCGLEAQLESVYRFLIQPDPWDTILVDANNQADLGEGIDEVVLQQRAAFLRADSLVAVIMLTDEDDSSADPLAVSGQGWAFMAKKFPGSNVFRAGGATEGTTASRGTSICATDPANPDCTSCGFAPADCTTAQCQKIRSDPNCQQSGQPPQTGPGYDGFFGQRDDQLNVRFHRMKQRYGVDPQFPLKRYIDGFTKLRVPDRKAEHVIQVPAGGGRRQIAEYTSTGKCTNPLFASRLPTTRSEELCNLPRSTRTSDLIFFAVIGGVPHQLLYPPPPGAVTGYDPNNLDNNKITNEKWVTILGRDPGNYNYEGIDSHMIQSVTPRPGLTGAELPRGNNGTDPMHGREWNPDKEDLQFACTFALPTSGQTTCTTSSTSCDCNPPTAVRPLTNVPLCEGIDKQVRAKAYPTPRELQVVRALGEQGIVASICPIDPIDTTKPTYGYRPAVATIIDRLKNALTQQCLPQKLREISPEPQPVDCLVLAQLSPDASGGCAAAGLKEPPKEILDVFREQQRAETGNVVAGGLDLASLPVCLIDQKVVPQGGSCENDPELAWCYVEKKPGTSQCPQRIVFSAGTQTLAGARFSLQCIKQFAAGQAAGDPATQTQQ
jgi:hypothetical protein